VDTLTEFDQILDLDFNVVRSGQTILPTISAVSSDKTEDLQHPGLRWGIGYWLRFDSMKRKQKKATIPKTNHPKRIDSTFQDSPYDPLSHYGIGLKNNTEELLKYLEISQLASNQSEEIRTEYTNYISLTHSKKPSVLQNNEKEEEFYNRYVSIDIPDPSYNTLGSFYKTYRR